MRDKYDFLHEDKHQRFIQAGTIVLLVIARHVQITENKKFAISLQYLKNDGRDEVDFLHADIHQTIVQVDTVNFGGHGQACSNYPK